MVPSSDLPPGPDDAPATAAKVLTLLQHEGLVRAQPRVGYVVAAARSAPGGDPELSRERIVRAAIDLADAEGLPALSMRAVAARLGVAAMSPYRYVESKDALIDAMVLPMNADGQSRCGSRVR